LSGPRLGMLGALRHERIDAGDEITPGHEGIAKVPADETGPPSDENAHLK